MVGYLRTRVRKQPIIALYFESETVIKFYDFEARKTIKIKQLALFPIKMIVILEGGTKKHHHKTGAKRRQTMGATMNNKSTTTEPPF